MKISNIAKGFVKKCDLFSTSQFLRYEGDQDYKTASGGVCSLIVIVVFIVFFMNNAVQTIDMTNITWTSQTSSFFNPSETKLTIEPKQGFMFAIGILGVNLNNATQRYFDISLIEYQLKRANIQTGKNILNMVPCTAEHFLINEEIKQSFKTLPTFRWLCPPLGHQFKIHGKYTSTTMQFLQVRLKKCNNSLDLSRPCAPDSAIEKLQKQLGQFTLSIFYKNPLINPGTKNYLSYYLQDRNFITFTRKIGAYGNGFIEDFQINTDKSLLPFTQNDVDQGTIISDFFQNIVYQITNENYASFYLMKSSRSITYLRSFTKLDTFFSYVGGLVGTILGLMVIVTKYSQFSFELELSEKLFAYKQDQANDFSNSNIFNYICYLFYSVLKFFKPCKKWQKMKQCYECREEILKQLSIDFILQRINFLESSVEIILNSNQLQGLHLKKYDTITQIKKRRRKYKVINVKNKDEAQPSQKDSDQLGSSKDNNRSIAQLNDIVIKNAKKSFQQVQFQQQRQEKVGWFRNTNGQQNFTNFDETLGNKNENNNALKKKSPLQIIQMQEQLNQNVQGKIVKEDQFIFVN